MANTTANPDFTPIRTINIIIQAGRYPINLKQRYLENTFICPYFFSTMFLHHHYYYQYHRHHRHHHHHHHRYHHHYYQEIIIIIVFVVVIRPPCHYQGYHYHHHFIIGKSKASNSPCISAEFGHCQNSRAELSAQQHQAQHKRSAVHQQQLS
jgi:hypothetical protein